MKTRKTCSVCGSTDIRIDAWAEWDEEIQEWVLSEVYDAAFCMGCEGECKIEEKEFPDEDHKQIRS